MTTTKKKVGRKLKRKVRARMKETGEPYTVALRAICAAKPLSREVAEARTPAGGEAS